MWRQLKWGKTIFTNYIFVRNDSIYILKCSIRVIFRTAHPESAQKRFRCLGALRAHRIEHGIVHGIPKLLSCFVFAWSRVGFSLTERGIEQLSVRWNASCAPTRISSSFGSDPSEKTSRRYHPVQAFSVFYHWYYGRDMWHIMEYFCVLSFAFH
jgi:hypothetical protein